MKRLRARAGAKLKRARERCGLSLRQIADSTKISVSVLEALERDDIKYLPGGVLGRGYVRAFAEAVKLDPEVIVAEFVAQFPESSVKDGYPPAEKIEEDKVAEVRTSRSVRLHASGTGVRVAAVAVVAIVLAGVVAFAAPTGWSALRRLKDSMESSTRRKLASLASRPIELLRPSQPPILPPALTQAMTISAQAIAKPRVTAPDSLNAIGTSMDAPARFEKPLRITLSASAQSWVIATVDGKKAISRFFEVGEQETLEARRELVVTAGNGGSIVMTLNGTVTRPLGRAGKTATVRVDHTNLDKYLKRGR
jgi:cytoskeletal protein RodZ